MLPRRRTALLHYYQALLDGYGPQGWWPARTPFEMIVGVILTQGVSWSNVERAIAALDARGLLDPARMRRAPRSLLARLVRPTGYFNQKAGKLKSFLALLQKDHAGDLDRLLSLPAGELRARLLGVHGIGPETADSIVLYAAGKPSFVVDAYTRRILRRHDLLHGNESYEEARSRIESDLPKDASIYNEYHALLVRVAKDRCLKAAPRCAGCPLEPYLSRSTAD